MIRTLLLFPVVLMAFAFAECLLAGPDLAGAFVGMSLREVQEPPAHDMSARTQGALLTPVP